MNGQKFFSALARITGGQSNEQLAALIGKLPVQVSQMKSREISELTMARIVASRSVAAVKALDLIRELKHLLDLDTDRSLAKVLGVTQHTLVNWKKQRGPVTAQKMAKMLKQARDQATAEAHKRAFRPIIEFFPVQPHQLQKAYAVFDTGPHCGKMRTGLYQELMAAHGLYVFYDARGKALYVGQAARQSIWKEMHSAFNRTRSAQRVAVVRHPKINVAYKPASEKLRQPVDTPKKLYELAAYFSAYEVATPLIGDFEALLIRAFPNDLLNFRMEKMGGASKATKKKRPRKPVAA
jgi:hypothetical protein